MRSDAQTLGRPDARTFGRLPPSFSIFAAAAARPREPEPDRAVTSRAVPALAAAGAGVGVSALGGLICTMSPPKQAFGHQEDEPFVLEGVYTHRVSTEASAQRLIDELTAEHLKREAP